MLKKVRIGYVFVCYVSYFTSVKCGTLLMLTAYSCLRCVMFVFGHYFLSSIDGMLALLMWKLYYVSILSMVCMIINQRCDKFLLNVTVLV